MTDKTPALAIGPGSWGRAVPAARPGRRRRRPTWFMLVVVVVIAAVFASGGWYFAGQIRLGALMPEPAGALPLYDDVKVVAVSADQVRLRAIGDQPDLTNPGLYGMAWRGGTGHLGAAVIGVGGLVTRSLTGIPRPGGDLPQRPRHGRRSLRLSAVRPDRVAGSAGGGAMGAGPRRQPRCPGRAVHGRRRRRRVPRAFAAGAGPLVWTAEQIAAARFGLSWRATDYLASTSWLRVPTLVTQGTADSKVPISLSRKLKALKPSLVTLALFPGAGHLESWNINQARYASLLTSFLSPVAPS